MKAVKIRYLLISKILLLFLSTIESGAETLVMDFGSLSSIGNYATNPIFIGVDAARIFCENPDSAAHYPLICAQINFTALGVGFGNLLFIPPQGSNAKIKKIEINVLHVVGSPGHTICSQGAIEPCTDASGTVIFNADPSTGGTITNFSVSAFDFYFAITTFRVEYDLGDDYVLNVSRLAQTSCGDLLDSSNRYTVAGEGCALTSLAMALNYSGQNYTPCSLNETLKKTSGFSGSDISWDLATRIATGNTHRFKHFKIKSLQALEDKLREGYPVVVWVRGLSGRGHFVVVNAIESGQIKIVDPGRLRRSLSDYGNVFETRGQVVPNVQTLSAETEVIITGTDAMEISATDSFGRRVGWDPDTQGDLNDIPGSVYFMETIENIDSGIQREEEGRYLRFLNPSDQEIQVTVTGTHTKNTTLYATMIKNGQILPTVPFRFLARDGISETFKLHEDGTLAPSLPPDSRGWLGIQSKKNEYFSGEHAFWLIQKIIGPGSADFPIRLEVYLNGNATLPSVHSPQLFSITSPELEPGFHELRVRYYLRTGLVSENLVDEAVSRIRVQPNGAKF